MRPGCDRHDRHSSKDPRLEEIAGFDRSREKFHKDRDDAGRGNAAGCGDDARLGSTLSGQSDTTAAARLLSGQPCGDVSICGEARRATCVVDGDTFWHLRVKIRIADIDAPELSPPHCETERMKGEAAKRRLLDLLNAGPFSLVAADRDEDRLGCKLRVVRRAGHSLGATLIAEGLARPWGGPRRNWCD